MDWLDDWGLSLATFLPVVGAAVLLFIPKTQEKLVQIGAEITAAAALIFGILVAIRFDYGNASGIQFDVNLEWIPQIGSRYHIGIDGMALPLFVLVAAGLVPVRDLSALARSRAG